MGLLEQILSEFDQSDKPRGRPLVTLSYAQSLDGSIAARRGSPLQISGDDSAIFTHQLRANHDSILVGVGTVLADDPRLTVRLVDGEKPQPVILDSNLRTPPNSTLVKANTPWIATTNKADPKKVELLTSLGVKLLYLPGGNFGQVSLQALLECLHKMGKRRVMVEGGAEVISSFIFGQLVDYLILTISPMIIGGLPAVQMPESISIEQDASKYPRLETVLMENFGDDLVVFGRPRWPKSKGN
jgi:3,4-dihydroxy 2-butanone 4-phosphate synthase/GTP cyclohydrolase II